MYFNAVLILVSLLFAVLYYFKRKEAKALNKEVVRLFEAGQELSKYTVNLSETIHEKEKYIMQLESKFIDNASNDDIIDFINKLHSKDNK